MADEQIAVLTATPDDANELTVANPDGPGGVTVTTRKSLVNSDEAKWLKDADLPDGYKLSLTAGSKDERAKLAAQRPDAGGIAGGVAEGNADGDTTGGTTP